MNNTHSASAPEYDEALIVLGNTTITGGTTATVERYLSTQIGPPFIVKHISISLVLQENPTPHTDPRAGIRMFVCPTDEEDGSGENIWGRYSESGGHDTLWLGMVGQWGADVGYRNRLPNQFFKAQINNNAWQTVIRFAMSATIQLRPDWAA